MITKPIFKAYQHPALWSGYASGLLVGNAEPAPGLGTAGCAHKLADIGRAQPLQARLPEQPGHRAGLALTQALQDDALPLVSPLLGGR